MTRIGVAITSAYLKPRPDRQAQGDRLAAQLGDLHIHTEKRPHRLPMTSRRCWEALLAVPDITHAVVMCDDMLPCEGFRDQLYAVVEANPDAVMPLIYARGGAYRALDKGVHWVKTLGGMNGSCLAPVDRVRDFLEWEHKYILPIYPHDDGRWIMYMLWHEQWAWAPIPSLLRHDLTLKSSLGHAGVKYDSRTFYAGEEVDWTSGLADPIVDRHIGFGAYSSREYLRLRRILGEPPGGWTANELGVRYEEHNHKEANVG